MRHRANLAITLLLLCSLTPSAFAEPRGHRIPVSKPKPASATALNEPDYTRFFDDEARGLLKLAFKAENAGKKAEALELFQKAHEVGQSAATEAELGLAELRAGEYVVAMRHMGRAMTTYKFQTMGRSDNYMLDKMDAGKKHVATIHVRVNVPGSTVNVDGDVIRDWPYHDNIYVVPGKHNVKAMKDGYWMSHLDVDIQAGKTHEVTLGLQVRVRDEVRNVHVPMNINISQGASEKEGAWVKPVMIGGGVGLALSGGALAMGLVKGGVAEKDQELERESINANQGGCSNSANAESCAAMDDAVRRKDTWYNVAIGGGIGMALSVGVLVIGIVSRPSSSTPITVTPTVGRTEAGATLEGRF